MATWFTADLHLGHTNIIEYCDRPFSDAATMTDALVANWNAVVAETDTVWVLGDVAMGRIEETLGEIHRFRGRKILVAGNHDRCWHGHGKRAEGWTERYLDAGFAEIVQGTTTIELAGTVVRMGHFPYKPATATLMIVTWSTDPRIEGSGCCTATSTRSGARTAA